MKSKVRKLTLSILISLLLSVAFLPFANCEEEERTSGPYKYIINSDGTATITYVYSSTFAFYNDSDNPTIASSVGGYTVSTLADHCFDENKYIKNITIPNSIIHFEGNPFVWLTGLTMITVSKDHPVLATIDGVLFDKTTKTLIAYPKGKQGSSYTIPNGIVAIGNTAFRSVTSLKEIILPDTLISIGDSSFDSCGIASISLPNRLEKIGAAAFGWTRIKEIVLPNSLKYIGRLAFIDTNIQSIHIPATVEVIEGNPFIRTPVQITVDNQNKNYKVRDGVLFDYSGEKLICYPCSLTAASYTIPSGCKIICANAFAYTSNSLKEINLPDSIEIIEKSAFQSSSITSLNLGDGITTIPEEAFYFCGDLKQITIPNSVTRIEAKAFAFSDLREIYIPSSVNFIGEEAFGSRYFNNMTIVVEEGSYAEKYVKTNKYNYSYPEITDWLNN